jgi:DNA-binding SARP family transcriptional activator
LVAHLAVVGAPTSRSRPAGLLWTDLSESAARANLRLTLSKLRRRVPQVQADRLAVWLDEPFWVDVAALEG